ncbi:MAG: hypothetical protein CMB37_02505 [Euryarchaeota archaeon]|nr:hypothetical protein [Euryarchaeota archaeon]
MHGKAHVGGHVTLIFSIQDSSEKLLEQGSRGAGMSINLGVKIEVEASPGSGKLSVHGDAPSSQLHNVVVEELTEFHPEISKYDWKLTHSTELPPSQGFGLSAAGSLATAIALQRALGIEEDTARHQAIHIAHRVERRLSGGLGDVAALYAGGVELRLEPGCPPLPGDLGGPGAVMSWYEEIPVVLIWRTTSSQHTSNYIDDGDWKLAIRAAGEHCLFGLREGIWDSSRWQEILAKSAEFSDRSGLLRDSNRLDLLHLVGSAFAGAGIADGTVVARLCMLGESAIVLPTEIPASEEWQDNLIENLRVRGLEACKANVASDPLNLQ